MWDVDRCINGENGAIKYNHIISNLSIDTIPVRLYFAMIIAGYVVGALTPDITTATIIFMGITSGICSNISINKKQ